MTCRNEVLRIESACASNDPKVQKKKYEAQAFRRLSRLLSSLRGIAPSRPVAHRDGSGRRAQAGGEVRRRCTMSCLASGAMLTN